MMDKPLHSKTKWSFGASKNKKKWVGWQSVSNGEVVYGEAEHDQEEKKGRAVDLRVRWNKGGGQSWHLG